MDEFDRDFEDNSKIGQIIGIVLCFIFIVGLLFGLIFIKHEQRVFNSDINNVDELITEQEKIIENKNKEINIVKIDINNNSDVDKLINDLITEYPKLAKELEEKIINEETDAKIAYLTFNGGPYELTNSILDVLDSYSVRATFFFNEKDETFGYEEDTIKLYDEIYKRVIKDGHTLANYTSSNDIDNESKNYIYKDTANFTESIKSNKKFIKDNYNYLTNIMRFPGGSSKAEELLDDIMNDLSKEPYGWIDWNSEIGKDDEEVDAIQSAKNIIDNTNDRKILVISLNDNNENTYEALPKIISGLSKKGYTLLPLFYDSVMVNKKGS